MTNIEISLHACAPLSKTVSWRAFLFFSFLGKQNHTSNYHYVPGLWRSREDARQGGTGPWHKKARGAARDLYEFINFSTLKLVIDNDASAFEFSDWLVDDE